ncbi:uncharacterized protein LOC108734319 [Agrilus planipennis]|uniref:Uncharacterized protein LOC108734319 n=1 Tax=Agrilus planipennis TaxID=224129 RepID=A0A1W4WLJ1_AGRPL|nr:uncharacterized protein LOC108734319 [Agrilus planipennis]XP_018321322.1 uncharacterized protein LOC108734319 [Agrilus planipennis]
MNKQPEVTKTTRYCVQWDSHARHICTVFCSLMEHQSLVDVAICCGPNTIHAHKCVLAANSPYFREQLEKNCSVEQILINGLDFTVVKSIIEFMYCGETNILNENLRYVVAAAKFFQMRGLQALVSDRKEVQNEASIIEITPPLFISKKPKYTNALRQFNPPMTNSYKIYKNPINDSYLYKKVKRKAIRSEAEKACAKEAAASRLALEALQKELANTPRINSFVIEESCTETTVENFIPHAEEAIFENLSNMPTIPIQMVGFSNLNNPPVLTTATSQMDQKGKETYSDPFVNLSANSIMKLDDVSDKIKNILGNEINGNVEIMFRTSDGNFVGVTDDLIQNLSGGGTLQYQVIDENGQLGDVREIQIQGQNSAVLENVGEHLLKSNDDVSNFVGQNQGEPSVMEIDILNTADSDKDVGSFSLENALNKDDTNVLPSHYDIGGFGQDSSSLFCENKENEFSGNEEQQISLQTTVFADTCTSIDSECSNNILLNCTKEDIDEEPIKKRKLDVSCTNSTSEDGISVSSTSIDVLPFREIFETNSNLVDSEVDRSIEDTS